MTQVHKLLLLLLFSFLSACAYTPVELQGDYANLTPTATSENNIGTRVRWGGVIIDTQANAEQTCIEVLSKDLTKSMRPINKVGTDGRFIACKQGFQDPEVYAKGRELTMTGQIEQLDKRKIGDFVYNYPIVATDAITLWPQRREAGFNNYRYGFGYGYPYGTGYGFGYGHPYGTGYGFDYGYHHGSGHGFYNTYFLGYPHY